MTLVKLGIVRVGQLYVCDRRFKLDNLHRQIVATLKILLTPLCTKNGLPVRWQKNTAGT